MNTDLAHIAARAFNTPLLIHPRKAEVLASVLAARLDGVAPLVAGAQMAQARAETERGRSAAFNRFDGEKRGPKIETDWGSYTEERYFYRDGLALITVEGTLVNRGAWIGASSGLTSYEGVKAQIGSALADADVETIILDLDSPGGEAVGAFEMADFVRAAAQRKPVVAFVDGMAASAAYAMASGATKIVAIPTGLVGSIGVVMLHLDRSKQMEKQGVAPTLIFAGAHKVDGHPFAALPDDVRAQFQTEIDDLYAAFVAEVAKGRPMTQEQIRATEARVFSGEEAVSLGLADAVGTLDDLVASLERGRAAGAFRGATMSHETKPAPQSGAQKDDATAMIGMPQADYNAALERARAEGAKTGAEAERARIAAIVDSEEAQGREAQARHFAFRTAMAPEDARAALAAAPKAPAIAGLDAHAPDHRAGEDHAEARQMEGAAAIAASWSDAFARVKR